MVGTLLQQLPPPPSKYGIDSVNKFYKRFTHDHQIPIETNNWRCWSKAAGIDNLSGRFLKDGAVILAKPGTRICNLSIKSGMFTYLWKLAKLKPLFKVFKNGPLQLVKIPISLQPWFQRYLRNLCMTKWLII